MVMGTVGYMAPEQVEGGDIDGSPLPTSSAFGCVLYEMLTGQRAFERDNAVETMTAILHDEPPDLAARTGLVPPALERVVRRCLEKNPAERFQSSNDLSFAIVNSTTVTSTSAKPIADSSVDRAASGRSTLRAALLAATGLAALVAALFLVLKPTDLSFERSAVRFEVPPPPDSRFGVGIALSPDGSQLAFVAPGPEGEDLLWVRPLSALVPRPLAGTEGAMLPFWSPDGERIAFFAKGKLKVVASAGGDVQSLCRAPGPEGGDWSRDGVLLLATHSGGRIVRVPATGGEPELVISGAKVPVHSPSFLPDGARFLYKRSSVGVLAARLDSESHGEMILSEFHSTARYAAPGYLVYRQGEDLMRSASTPRVCASTGSRCKLPTMSGGTRWDHRLPRSRSRSRAASPISLAELFRGSSFGRTALELCSKALGLPDSISSPPSPRAEGRWQFRSSTSATNRLSTSGLSTSSAVPKHG